jgi:hypothetical protein
VTVLLPAWLQAGSYTAELDRKPLSALGTPSGGTNLYARGGVFRGMGGEFAVAQTGTASMSVLVGSGYASVVGSFTLTQGNYITANDATVTLPITTANGANPRIDIIVLEVLDSAYSGASDLAQLRVVPGTPASSPAVPATPPSSIVLARVTVPAGATSIPNSNIADVRPFTGASGGILPVTASDVTNGAYSGHYRDHPTGGLQRWNGSSWSTNWGTVSNASLQSGWTGAVTYSVDGRGVTLNTQVLRTGANIALNAWGTTPLATGLPPANSAGTVGVSGGQNIAMALTNMDRDGGFQINIDSSGVLSLVCRWASNTVITNGWVACSTTYLS